MSIMAFTLRMSKRFIPILLTQLRTYNTAGLRASQRVEPGGRGTEEPPITREHGEVNRPADPEKAIEPGKERGERHDDKRPTPHKPTRVRERDAGARPHRTDQQLEKGGNHPEEATHQPGKAQWPGFKTEQQDPHRATAHNKKKKERRKNGPELTGEATSTGGWKQAQKEGLTPHAYDKLASLQTTKHTTGGQNKTYEDSTAAAYVDHPEGIRGKTNRNGAKRVPRGAQHMRRPGPHLIIEIRRGYAKEAPGSEKQPAGPTTSSAPRAQGAVKRVTASPSPALSGPEGQATSTRPRQFEQSETS
eukprot:gene23821-9385_t